MTSSPSPARTSPPENPGEAWPRRAVPLSVIGVLVGVVLVLVGLGLAISYSAPGPDKDYQRVRQIVEVLAEVDANFVRQLSDEE